MQLGQAVRRLGLRAFFLTYNPFNQTVQPAHLRPMLRACPWRIPR
jgi:hypothetical protein